MLEMEQRTPGKKPDWAEPDCSTMSGIWHFCDLVPGQAQFSSGQRAQQLAKLTTKKPSSLVTGTRTVNALSFGTHQHFLIVQSHPMCYAYQYARWDVGRQLSGIGAEL